MAIGNMSKVYTAMGDKERSKDCLEIASKILSDLLGEQNQEYQHFKGL
jgi:hypothetical protein